MDYKEANEWLKGTRSSWNFMAGRGEHDAVDAAKVDAAMTEQAYWVMRAYKEGLIEGESHE